MIRKSLSLVTAVAAMVLLAASQSSSKAQTVYNFSNPSYVYSSGTYYRGSFQISRGLVSVAGVQQNRMMYYSNYGYVEGVVDSATFLRDTTGKAITAHVLGHGSRKDYYGRITSVTIVADVKLYATGGGAPSIVVHNLNGTVAQSTAGFVAPGAFTSYLK